MQNVGKSAFLLLFWKQVVFHDFSSCSDFVFPFLNKEYVLAHTEMPTTLEGAEAAIKKQEDFMTTMDANEEKIDPTSAQEASMSQWKWTFWRVAS